MKKVMIGILIVIPIIIVLIVAAVSQFVSLQAWISVDDFSIYAKDTETPLDRLDLKLSDSEEGDTLDLSEYIDITVMPSKANSYSIQYTIVGEIQYFNHGFEQAYLNYINGDSDEYAEPGAYAIVKNGKVDPQNINTTGIFKLNTVCAFTIGINVEHIQKTIMVQVMGDVPDSAELNILKGSDPLTVGESLLLEASFDPPIYNAKETQWLSNNESVATVENGIVIGVAPGTAEITSYSFFDDSEGEEHRVMSDPFTVTVVAGVSSKFGNSLITGKRELPASELGLNIDDIDFASSEGIELSGDTITLIGDSQKIKTKNGKTMNISVCSEDDIKINHAQLYNYDADSERNFVLGIDDAPLTLSVSWADMLKTDAPGEIEWTTDNDDVATVNNGKVVPVGSGLVTITAKLVGTGARASVSEAKVTLNVRKKIGVLLLKTTEANLAVGLARETVFATNKYDDAMAVTDNTVTIEIMDQPTNAAQLAKFVEDYKFSVKDGNEYAYFDDGSNQMRFKQQDGVYALEGKGKQKIVVEVRAKYPKSYLYEQDYVKTVSLNVVYGISVTDIDQLRAAAKAQDAYMRKEGNYVGEYLEPVTSLNDINYYVKHAESSINKLAIVLDGDCAFKDGESHASKEISNFKGDLYGNAHMISSKASQANWSYGMIGIGASDVVLSNVTLRGSEMPENSTIDKEDTSSFEGTVIKVCYERNNETYVQSHISNIRMEYSIIENARMGMRGYNCDLDIDGCLFRNFKSSGIYFPQHIINSADGKEAYLAFNRVKMNNTVSSNAIATFINTNYESVSQNYDYKTGAHPNRFYANDEENARFYRENFVDKGYNYEFTQTGFLDIYNWTTTSDTQLIDLYNDEYNQLLASVAEPVLTGNDLFKEARLFYNDEYWFHLGFFISGIHIGRNEDKIAVMDEPTYATVNLSSNEFYSIYSRDLVPRTGLGTTSVAERLISRLEFRIYGYSKEATLTPASTYKVDLDFINSLHS